MEFHAVLLIGARSGRAAESCKAASPSQAPNGGSERTTETDSHGERLWAGASVGMNK